MTLLLNFTCKNCKKKYTENPGGSLNPFDAIYCPICRDIPKEPESKKTIEVGDILIEWSYGGWERKDKHFRKHTVTKVTPTGRIKTDNGLELNPNLSIRGEHYRGRYISLFTEEIKLEMKKQREKDELHNTLRRLGLHNLLPEEIELLNKAFEPILERLKGEKQHE